MPPLIRAIVTPSVLVWARERLGLSLPDTAAASLFDENRLQAWEDGSMQPTIRQARRLAKLLRVPFAAFFLPDPPQEPIPLPRDYRRVAGTTLGFISADFLAVVQNAANRREIALELLQEQNTLPHTIRRSVNVSDDPDETGAVVRDLLGVTLTAQRSWRNTRVAFNAWREAAESAGTLVFQESSIAVEIFRGFCLFHTPLPVVVVNRKDGYSGRIFTLLHEFTHLLLQSGGICDLHTAEDRPPEEQATEIFCNAVAASCLMPVRELLRHPLMNVPRSPTGWSDDDIEFLALHFSVSREALLRRLLTLERTTQRFYEQKRRQYSQEFQQRTPPAGFPPPATNAISLLGKPYVKLVLTAYNSGVVTASDASDFLGLKTSHFPTLADAVGV